MLLSEFNRAKAALEKANITGDVAIFNGKLLPLSDFEIKEKDNEHPQDRSEEGTASGTQA